MWIRHSKGVLAALLLALASGANAETLKLTDASFMAVDEELKSAKGHPNEEWRLHGLKSYLNGHYREAIEHFERAASYADKFSQHYLSLIYWHGQGVPPDRVRAYIWSDLAAERGSRTLLLMREKMWSELTAEQQNQVGSLGPDFYAKYGDDVAKPRAEAEIRRFTRGMTGSKVGYRNSKIDTQAGGPIQGSFGNSTAGMMTASSAAVGTATGDQLYAEERTSLTDYWRIQDSDLDKAGSGRVEVGEVQPAAKPERKPRPD